MGQKNAEAIIDEKRAYESAKMEILRLSVQDVIVTSMSAGDDPGEGNWSGFY